MSSNPGKSATTTKPPPPPTTGLKVNVKPVLAGASQIGVGAVAGPSGGGGGAAPSTTPNKAPGGGGGVTYPTLESFCTEIDLVIPPALPDILRQYSKAAMKMQPQDLLAWSGTYFRALANGQPLPVRPGPD